MDRSRLECLGCRHAATNIKVFDVNALFGVETLLFRDVVGDIAEGKRRVSNEDFLGRCFKTPGTRDRRNE